LKNIWMEIVALVAIVPTVTSASDRKPLGEIDFFGYKGFDVEAIRSAVPFHEGDLFPPAKAKSSDDLKRQVREKIKQFIGRPPTDVSFVCCDSKQNWMVYIGLPGESYQPLDFNPAPAGDIRLPKAPIALLGDHPKPASRDHLKTGQLQTRTQDKIVVAGRIQRETRR